MLVKKHFFNAMTNTNKTRKNVDVNMTNSVPTTLKHTKTSLEVHSPPTK